MSSKKKDSKKLFENMNVEPEHANQELPESTPVPEEDVAETKEAAKNEVSEPVVPSTGIPPEESPDTNQEGESADEILEDVRRSLIEEEEAHEKAEQPKWWKRIGKGSRKKAVEQELPKVVEEIDLPGLDTTETKETNEEVNQELVLEQEPDPIDELIDMLDKEETSRKQPVVEETPSEPEKVVDLEELKKQAFQPRSSTEQAEDLTQVRSIALEGGEEVFVEVESTKQDPLEERLTAMENAVKPYRQYIYFGIAVLGVVMAVIAGAILFNVYKQSVATPPAPVDVSDLPYPTSVSLPGGWSFQLGKGMLDAGQWNPQGAEWLQGTEVCRWVSLPWSRQLEAVIRTLNPDDPIDLGMSNNDVLTYQVSDIKQMSPEEMQQLDSNKPCLLIILAEPKAEKRWVLTALP